MNTISLMKPLPTTGGGFAMAWKEHDPMNYYKVLLPVTAEDGTTSNQIVDAQSGPLYVRYNEKKNLMLLCTASTAQGITDSLGAGMYWHVDGLLDFPESAGVTDTVVLEEIDEETYAAIHAALEAGQSVVEEETEEEADTDPDGSVALVRANVLMNMETAYKAALENGIALKLSDGETYQISLSAESQSDMYGLLLLVNNGATEVDFYTTDGTCITISAEDVTTLVTVALPFRSYQLAYYHCLQNWINSLESVTALAAIQYGDTIPDEYVNEYLVKYATALGVAEYAQNET